MSSPKKNKTEAEMVFDSYTFLLVLLVIVLVGGYLDKLGGALVDVDVKLIGEEKHWEGTEEGTLNVEVEVKLTVSGDFDPTMLTGEQLYDLHQQIVQDTKTAGSRSASELILDILTRRVDEQVAADDK